LNRNAVAISSLVPNRFLFSEGEFSSAIQDGGFDMYDFGNLLDTGVAPGSFVYIPYTNGVVTTSDAARLGAGSTYFTAKYPGLFVLAATNVPKQAFRISGNLGANFAGRADGAVLEAPQGYTVFVKRVSGASTPSVNHIIIVP